MSDKQLEFIKRLCDEKGIALEDATKAAIGRRQSKLGKKGASKVIDYLMAQPSVKHVPRPASAKQRDYIASLATKVGVEAPAVETAQEASEAIERLKAQAPKPRRQSRSGGGRSRRNSRPSLGEGEQVVSRRSSGRDDGYDVGSTLHLQRVAGGGGPDGHYWTVTWAGKGMDEDEEDWMCIAHVRPATDEEAAPVAERIAARQRREELRRELGRLVRSVETLTDKRPPQGRELVLHRNLAGHRKYILAEDGSVWESESSYDDVPRAWKTTDPRAAEIMEELLAAD